MKILVIAVLYMVVAAQWSCSEAVTIQEARQRNDEALLEHENKYHKDVHLKQEMKVAAMKKMYAGKPASRSPVNPDDLAALTALYNATNGPKWANSTGWFKGDPCTNPMWFGVYCPEDRVLQITLVDNGLEGYIPAALAKASSLQVLRLYSNLIGGPIPVEVLLMQSLQILDLNNNLLTGTLPSEISMPALTQFSLYANQLTGKFPSKFDTPNLQIAELSSNSFSGDLPDSLADCPSLTNLVISRNMLTGKLPSSYGTLRNLKIFWIFINKFDNPTIPDSYQGMTSLEQFEADNLSGILPSWIGSWSKMQYLLLTNGQLTGGFPESLCNCADMISLRLFNNSLKGDIPRCMCDMRSLQDIELSDNHFTGPIPDCIGDCSSLQSVYFSRNNMSGTFPVSIGDLRQLTLLDISSNSFYGVIPNSINSLSATIAEFAVCYNLFSSVEDGAQDFFNRIKDYGCQFYDNPWSCPLPSSVAKECQADCSRCNSGETHSSCYSCIKDTTCGWCGVGDNCLEGNAQGPDSIYNCDPSKWTSGSSATCP